ncbi:hypothetical protein N657DRAFT_672912 [Parathielavia appendiculata]|uniref:FAD-binding PCMH-type domain-containing protein n=1 Tax=Parathielavia appendiculata TaxID=2587402 RepID=A0AAN6Z297_9PEZI|nr:hypothetical protein N657DRAFT_672912 [Parathielavia appendiculata]
MAFLGTLKQALEQKATTATASSSPGHRLRRKVTRYSALVPNGLFAASLRGWLSTSQAEPPLPCLESTPAISGTAFGEAPAFDIGTDSGIAGVDGDSKFDLILLCNHGLYGPNPEPDRNVIQRALEMLVERDGLLVLLHREGLYLDGLVARRTVLLPGGGVIRVPSDDDERLDCFAAFMAGFAAPDEATAAGWRDVCRVLGRRGCSEAGASAHQEEGEGAGGEGQDQLVFRAPGMVMASFTRHAATALGELTVKVPSRLTEKPVKNSEARLRCPAAIVRPTGGWQVQECVRWALRHGVGLTVIGGGHSGHCLWPHVVAIDMDEEEYSSRLVHAPAASTTGDIVRAAMGDRLAVPLGARPSVGAGSWLQGGIGHLARLHGLACDAIVNAKVVGLASGEIRSVGCLPDEFQSVYTGAASPSDLDLLWAIKGAGTNFGIVIDVVFKTYAAPKYLIRKWLVPLGDVLEARHKLRQVGKFVGDQLRLGVTMLKMLTAGAGVETPTTASVSMSAVLGPQTSCVTVDGVGVFDTKMYVSEMNHGCEKPSSFKRSLFLNDIGEANSIADILVAAIEARPTPLSYLYLAQGGGAVGDVGADATAFGCRDWDFACTIAGVWPRSQERFEIAQAAVDWVYKVGGKLLPVSRGAYSADLGPDPRDTALAASAFGPNLPRLARLKRKSDPRNVLASACPLPRIPMEPKLIVLVTGASGVGKDYCADIWVRSVVISEATKREYAAATGADVDRLLRDRAYKDQQRPSLTAFWESQVQQRPRLPEEHFMNAVYAAADVDVLFITGMRDEAPVAAFSYLVPDSRLLDVRVQISERTGRGSQMDGKDGPVGDSKESNAMPTSRPSSDYHTSYIFNNDATGTGRPLPMVRPIPDFPSPGIEFCHVLDIAQRPAGLTLCTSLLEQHFSSDWNKIDRVVCCEAGGFVFATALAVRVNVPLVLIREAGKLPPPTVSVDRSPSHISASASSRPKKRIEMDRDAIPSGASVLVVDDVLATGQTLCAVLRLLGEAGVAAENVSAMVVAEFLSTVARICCAGVTLAKLRQARGSCSSGLEFLVYSQGS